MASEGVLSARPLILENEQLQMLLKAVEWRGRGIRIVLEKLDIVQFISLGEVEGTRFGAIAGRAGYPQWWTWPEKVDDMELLPDWWKTPNDVVVSR